VYGRPDNPSNPAPPEPHAEVFPFVFTVARLTEYTPPAELAAERGLVHLSWAHVITSRTAVEARVHVTGRLAPLRAPDWAGAARIHRRLPAARWDYAANRHPDPHGRRRRRPQAHVEPKEQL
jgi:hypothetical protein